MLSSDQPPETLLELSLASDDVEVENEDEDHSDAAYEDRSDPESEDRSDAESEDHSDAESESSTVVYEQEPFESFRGKVLEFALTIWTGADPTAIEVSRMQGGGYNRIISISRVASEQEESAEYVLRIPRFDAARLDRDVAALLYAKKLGNIPVPDVVAFDETSNNKLGFPYMVQKRLVGIDLLSIFPDLDHNQKCRVASELGQFFNRLLSKKSTVAGRLILPADITSTEDQNDEVIMEPFFQPKVPTVDQLEPNLTTRDLLSRVFEERKAESLRRYPQEILEPRTMDRFTAMANDLHQGGWFANNDISLCHLDFEPRNILIDTARDTTQQIISGILDWDSAVLAPSFMSCAPPQWIWAWTDEEDEEDDERTANDVPLLEEDRLLKKIFEDAAGAEFVGYAYPPAYRLARRLVSFAIDGMRSNEHLREAEAMLKEWEEIRGELKV